MKNTLSRTLSLICTYMIGLLIIFMLSCDKGKKPVSHTVKKLNEADWSAFQKILDIGIVQNSYKGTYGPFQHNAFDYEKLMNDELFQSLLKEQIQNLKTAKAPEETKAKLAFWINAYNFFTIVDVCSNYPLPSMKEIGWKNTHHQVGNAKYSLDHIEHKILRPMKEAKIHFALNCASVSCPGLNRKIFTEQSINEELTRLTKNALKNPLHIQLSSETVSVTKLMDWFEKDFEVEPYNSVEGFIEAYAPEELHGQVNDYIDYDWALNTPKNIEEAMTSMNLEKVE